MPAARAAGLEQGDGGARAEVARRWASAIERAQAPLPFSSRDGKALKPVPAARRLPAVALAAAIDAVLKHRHFPEASDMLLRADKVGEGPKRHELAIVRAEAYLHSKCPAQALKDAKVALVYSAGNDGVSTWAWAHAVHGTALMDLQDNTSAALAMKRALELNPACPEVEGLLEVLLRRIPPHHAEVLQSGGSAGLQRLLHREAEEALPEYKRPRPKYFYYYEWMKERLAQACGALPEPVVDKLLTLEATELDMLLTYPRGIQAQAAKLIDILTRNGPAFLETYRVPTLTWQQAQALKASYSTARLEDGGHEAGALLDQTPQICPSETGKAGTHTASSTAFSHQPNRDRVLTAIDEYEDLDGIEE